MNIPEIIECVALTGLPDDVKNFGDAVSKALDVYRKEARHIEIKRYSQKRVGEFGCWICLEDWIFCGEDKSPELVAEAMIDEIKRKIVIQ